MSKSFQDWLKEGEMLYDGALGEYRRIESQLDELEKDDDESGLTKEEKLLMNILKSN